MGVILEVRSLSAVKDRAVSFVVYVLYVAKRSCGLLLERQLHLVYQY